MLSKPIDPNCALQTLIDEGFDVEVREQHLLLHNVPFVKGDRSIGRGSLICTFFANGDLVQPPDNHQVWWTEEYPCFASGMPIEQFRNEDGERELFPGQVIKHRFSNKPEHFNQGFPDHYSKLIHYASLLQAQASVLSPGIDSKKQIPVRTNSEGTSPFAYSDSASARAAVLTTSSRLENLTVGIVGVGGTGGYVLDQLAKTPVAAIHIFDADTFEQHNAFRAPGAASLDDIVKGQKKVDYFARIYSRLHRGVVAHPYNIEAATINELNQCDFVFLCVDHGRTRAFVGHHLISLNIPFIDVGMNLHLVTNTNKLVGTCRATLCAPDSVENFTQRVPVDEDDDEVIYRQNIQIADMNALNAQFAVIMWKQHYGFYQDDFGVSNVTFSLNTMSLVRVIKTRNI